MKVKVDMSLCDGNGMCAVECPEVFEMDDDSLVLLTEEVGEELRADVERAAVRCPKQAITVGG